MISHRTADGGRATSWGTNLPGTRTICPKNLSQPLRYKTSNQTMSQCTQKNRTLYDWSDPTVGHPSSRQWLAVVDQQRYNQYNTTLQDWWWPHFQLSSWKQASPQLPSYNSNKSNWYVYPCASQIINKAITTTAVKLKFHLSIQTMQLSRKKLQHSH